MVQNAILLIRSHLHAYHHKAHLVWEDQRELDFVGGRDSLRVPAACGVRAGCGAGDLGNETQGRHGCHGHQLYVVGS